MQQRAFAGQPRSRGPADYQREPTWEWRDDRDDRLALGRPMPGGGGRPPPDWDRGQSPHGGGPGGWDRERPPDGISRGPGRGRDSGGAAYGRPFDASVHDGRPHDGRQFDRRMHDDRRFGEWNGEFGGGAPGPRRPEPPFEDRGGRPHQAAPHARELPQRPREPMPRDVAARENLSREHAPRENVPRDSRDQPPRDSRPGPAWASGGSLEGSMARGREAGPRPGPAPASGVSRAGSSPAANSDHAHPSPRALESIASAGGVRNGPSSSPRSESSPRWPAMEEASRGPGGARALLPPKAMAKRPPAAADAASPRGTPAAPAAAVAATASVPVVTAGQTSAGSASEGVGGDGAVGGARERAQPKPKPPPALSPASSQPTLKTAPPPPPAVKPAAVLHSNPPPAPKRGLEEAAAGWGSGAGVDGSAGAEPAKRHAVAGAGNGAAPTPNGATCHATGGHPISGTSSARATSGGGRPPGAHTTHASCGASLPASVSAAQHAYLVSLGGEALRSLPAPELGALHAAHLEMLRHFQAEEWRRLDAAGAGRKRAG